MNRLYDALPVSAQNLACTWDGYRRGRSRYTRHFHQTLRAWNESLYAPLGELHECQRNRLDHLIEIARSSVQYYQDIPPASTAKDPARAIEETLANIKPLEKKTYRASPERFISDSIPKKPAL